MSQLDSKVEVFILLSEEQVRKPIIFNENEYVLFSCPLIPLPFLPLLHKPLSESLGTYRIWKFTNGMELRIPRREMQYFTFKSNAEQTQA